MRMLVAVDVVHCWRWALVLWFAQPVQAARIADTESNCKCAKMPYSFYMQVDLNYYIHLLLSFHIGLKQ